jgi:ATP phosphoribosyltransferase
MSIRRNLKIAIQKSGRLNKPSRKFLAALGLRFGKIGRNLALKCENQPIDLLNVRDDDIPKYVSESIVDFGIVGIDVLKESGKKAQIIKKLGFCQCKLVIASPKNSSIRTVRDLNNKKIATSYPRILSNYLTTQNIKARVVVVQGSVELTPYLQAADAVCDITETGRTLREFNLVPIKAILNSQAVLISPVKQSGKQAKFINQLLTKNI